MLMKYQKKSAGLLSCGAVHSLAACRWLLRLHGMLMALPAALARLGLACQN